MRRHILGRTGLEVSEIALGTVELGLDYGIGAVRKPMETDAAGLLHFALDQGVTLIDTARAYGDAERVIGAALKGRRHEYVLISKVKPAGDGVPELVEVSLRELQTDHIDVMMLHCGLDPAIDWESTAALERCRDAGKVRYIGASTYGPEAALNAIRSGRYDCIEIAYSVLDRRPENEVLGEAAAANIGILARSVLLKGALTARYRELQPGFESLQHCVEQLAAIAGSIEKLPELAYRYVLSRTPPHAALIGTASVAELRAGIAYADRGPLSEDEIRAAGSINVDDERWLNPGTWPAEARS